MNQHGIVSLFCVAMLLACGAKPSGTEVDGGVIYTGSGPIDGTWGHTSYTCNGAAQTMGGESTALVINNASGFLLNTKNSCGSSEVVQYVYPTSSSVTLKHSQQVTCTPTACGIECSPTVTKPDETYNYVLTGNTVKMSRVISATDSDCPVGETAEHTFTRQ